MELEVKIQLLKFCFHIVNSIFLVLGVSVAACAVWILFDAGSLLSVLPSGNAWAQLYLGLLVVLLLGQLFVTLLLLLNTNKVSVVLRYLIVLKVLTFVNITISVTHGDHLGQCCGRTGPSDWFQDVNRTDVLPCSCFNVSRTSFSSAWCSEELIGPGGSFYEEGCQQKIRVMLQENVLTIAIMDFGLIFMQVTRQQPHNTQFYILVCDGLDSLQGALAVRRTDAPDDSDHAHLDPAPEEDSDIPVQNYDYINPEESSRDPTLPYHHDNQNYNYENTGSHMTHNDI
uniref:Tetraspanin n=1 Tax=Mola mola TaxID=94237 RepID=A0A3Q4BBE4_MOLML